MTHYPAHSKIYNIKTDSLDSSKLNSDKQHSIINKNVILMNTINENLNSLSGLLAHYDSDSEHEDLNGQETDKLDAKVDDFLQEINKIVPNESNESDIKRKDEQSCAWQECFDESTGYPYYWNTETNTVTWEMPAEYKKWYSLNTVPKLKPPLPVKGNTKVDLISKILSVEKENKPSVIKRKVCKPEKKVLRKQSTDSEEEKIVMITSFSEGSSSESDNDTKIVKSDDMKMKEQIPMGPYNEDVPKESELFNRKEIVEKVKEENIDETIILARLRTQAKVLHELGGDISKSLEKSVAPDLPDSCKPQSLALVAGYGDDSEPEEESTIKSLFPIPNSENLEIINEQSQSTLFPATKPIDVKQFEVHNKPQTYSTNADDDSVVDNKIFKRKKRLGVAFDVSKVEKKQKISDTLLGNELNSEDRKGFGFQSESNTNDNENRTDKISFLKGGIAFVKADVLNPAPSEEKPESVSSDNEKKLDDFEQIKEIVSEKVNFLGEGKDPVSAVQVMAIQLQTLELAYKAGGLTQKYMWAWLRETFVDLEKLEQEAAPDGWQCQWDRSNKRYFYRNVNTSEWQWEFPVDIVGGGEAMDICTTPPQNEGADSPEPQPSPPKYLETSSTPPPPPPLSITFDEKHTLADDKQPPMPSVPPPIDVVPPPPPVMTSVSENQPLPPGVDSPDLPFFASKQKDKESSTTNEINVDSLGSQLDSFYSDIALLEATGSNIEVVKSDMENVPSPSSATNNDTATRKKKRSKSKLGQGINMKKKAVSTLVEKWKKVQNDYL